MTPKWKNDFRILKSENLKLILNYSSTELDFDFQFEEFFSKGELHLLHALVEARGPIIFMDFFYAGVYVFSPIGRTQLLRLECQSIFWVVYVLFSLFTAHGC